MWSRLHPTSVVGLVALLALLAGCGRVAGQPLQSTVTDALRVTEDSVGQTFRPAAPLTRVDLLVATFDQSPDPEGSLTVTVSDAATNELLRTVRAPGDRLTDNRWLAVHFEPLTEPPAVVAVEATWDGQTPVGLWANVAPATADGDRLVNDPYPGGQLLLEGRAAPGDLAFRAVGGGGAETLAVSTVRILSGAVAGLGARPLFAAGWLALLVGALALGWWGLRGAPGELDRRRPGQ